MMLNNLLSFLRDTLSSWLLDPLSSSSLHKYLDTYTVLFSLMILCGCTVNILVIAAYKLGHRKRLLSSNGVVRYSHMHAAFNINLASTVRHTNSQGKLKAGMAKNDTTISFDKSSSVVHTSLKKTTENQAVLYKRHSIHQAGYDLRRSLRQSTNSLMYMSHDHLTVNRMRHTLCSYFILSLGYCDLFICCLIMPMSLVIQSDYFQQYLSDFISSDYIYADLACQLSFYLVQIPLVLEIEILLTIAIDRYSSVFNPIKIYFFDRNKSKLTLIAQILLSFILSLPNLLFYTSSSSSSKKVNPIQSNNSSLVAADSNNFNNNNISRNLLYSLSNYCKVREEYYDLYSYYQFVLLFLFLLNLVTISVFYLKVYCHVYKVSCDQRVEQISQQRSSIASNLSVKIQNQDLIMYENLSKFMGKFVSKPRQVPIAPKIRSLSGPDQMTDFTPALNNIEENAFEAEFNETNETNQFIITNLDASPKRESKDRQNSFTPLKLKRSQSCPILLLNSGKKKVSIASSVSMCNHHLKSAVDLKCTKRSSTQARSQKIALKYINDTVIFDPATNSDQVVDPSLCNNRSSIRALFKPSTLVELKLNGPVRRFSEMNISFKKNSKKSATSRLSTQQHPMLVRRHTQKIFKHSKTARTLGLATLALAITWFPYWYHLIRSLKANREEGFNQIKSVSLYGFICIKLQMNSFYLNYVLNPIFYSFVNRRFRQNVQVFFKNMVRSFFGFFLCCCNYNSQKIENIPTKDDAFKA